MAELEAERASIGELVAQAGSVGGALEQDQRVWNFLQCLLDLGVAPVCRDTVGHEVWVMGRLQEKDRVGEKDRGR